MTAGAGAALYCFAMTRITHIAVTGAAAAALVLAAAPSAQARINPEVGIAKVKLDNTQKQVIKKKGQPGSREKVQNEILGSVTVFKYGPNGDDLEVTLYDKRVIGVGTRSAAERTTGGTGVGSTQSEVKAEFPQADCEKIGGRKQICMMGDFNPGEAVTTFRLTRKVVTEVEVARVID